MQPVEASVVVPLSPEETWAFLWDDPRRAVEHFDDILAVEDYQLRDDGTPKIPDGAKVWSAHHEFRI